MSEPPTIAALQALAKTGRVSRVWLRDDLFMPAMEWMLVQDHRSNPLPANDAGFTDIRSLAMQFRGMRVASREAR